MPEIIIELSLNRSSGVLAGIVASLAQAGIELQSQKLQRATESRGGWLTITGSGESPNPAALAERLNGTRGVEKLMRVIVDGEAVLAQGKPLEDQIQTGDLAELSAGSDSEPEPTQRASDTSPPADSPREGRASAPDIQDLPILSETGAGKAPPPDAEAGREQTGPEAVDPMVAPDHSSAPGPDADGAEASVVSASTTDPSAEGDLEQAIRDDGAGGAEENETSHAGDEDSTTVQVPAVLRRRRRRRR